MNDFDSLIQDAILHNTVHAYYNRVCELAKTYRTIVTGDAFKEFLVMFKRREEDEDFEQRITITTENLSAVASPVTNQFARLSSLQNIRKGIDYSLDTEVVDTIQTFLSKFYANGLEYFLSVNYDRKALLDPNAFLVIEFRAVGDGYKPYGVVYSSEEVVNFEYDQNEVLQYLLVKIAFTAKDQEGKKLEGFDYVLYAGKQAIKYTLWKSGKDRVRVGVDALGKDVFDTEKGDFYVIESFSPMAPEVQAMRLGYIKDDLTNFKTCVSPLQPAVPKFVDLIRTKSNFDLTKFIHTFPQKVMRKPACPGEDETHTCYKGNCPQTGEQCKKCGGTGQLTITQPTDTLVITDDASSDEVIKLESVIFYVKPETETFKLLRNDINDLTNEIYVAVFNNELTPHQSTNINNAATATEISVKREDINNTLLPFAKHKSEVYKFCVRHIASIVVDGINLEKLQIHYEFPKDLKLSTITELYADLKTATDSGAPPFVIEQIIDDIAAKLYEGDEEALHRYRIKARHIPFLGLSLDLIKYFDSKNYLRKEDLIKLAYQDSIFADLERLHKDFWQMPEAEQDTLIGGYVKEILASLPTDATVQINTNRRLLTA